MNNILKRLMIILMAFAFVFTLAGCKEDPANPTPDNPPIDNPTGDNLKEPVIDWWSISNPNGFDTFSLSLKNPNKEDIDITFNVTFYLDGKKVGYAEDWYYNSMIAGEKGLCWGNYDIPEKADKIEVEYTYVGKAYYQTAKVKVKSEKKTTDGVSMEFKVDGNWSSGVVYVAFFNGNDFVFTSFKQFVPSDELEYEFVSFSGPYTKYEVYTNFY